MKRYKIGIMGGTFNPIHNGHILLAQAAYEYCSLDKVLFMPSGVSYLKEQSEILTAQDRMNMTLLAVEAFEQFDCSDLEVKREGNTYTVDTLRELNTLYPDNDFYFIMGADSFMALDTWKEPEEIAKLCTIVTVIRDDVDHSELEIRKEELQNKWGASIVLMPFAKTDISSSQIRRNVRQGLDVAGLMPSKVEAYIRQRNLYCDGDFLKELRDEMKNVLSPERFEHTLGVMDTAKELAKKYGIELRKAEIAGLLHDCAKCYPFDTQLMMCDKYDVVLTELERTHTELIHSKLGAVLAKVKYGIYDKDILESIKNHTTGRPGMSMLEKIVFVADYIEPNRYKAKNLPEIRKLAYENIDTALIRILEDTLQYLKDKSDIIDECTEQTLNYYKLQ